MSLDVKNQVGGLDNIVQMEEYFDNQCWKNMKGTQQMIGFKDTKYKKKRFSTCVLLGDTP